MSESRAGDDPAKRRRRRRRRGGGDRPEAGDRPEGSEPRAAAPAPAAGRDPRPRRPERDRADRPGAPGPRGEPPPRDARGPRPPRDGGERQAARDRRDRPRAGEPPRPAPPPAADERPAHDRIDTHDDADEPAASARFVPDTDDGTPAPPVTLAADLPAEPPADDPDPVSHAVLDGPDPGAALLARAVANVVGVKLAAAGKIAPYDAGDARYARGDRVVVDTERGPRLGTVAVESLRQPATERSLRRVLRRASEADLRADAMADEQGRVHLRTAKEIARRLGLPIKVFRVDVQPGRRLLVYFNSEDRLDLRDFLRDLGGATGARIELRQIGAREEAKLIGGIGSCGLELCCSSWLPEMVPVSIKMAKDQGLVLNPQKVSGQCGRLKCCLVYEQATYAELRKGLPKLGKRVITPHGEGRVVEVDVLRQRIRVATGPGEFHVLTAGEVTPMFPSGNQQQPGRGPAPDLDEPDDPSDDPAAS